jgi:hypothetical protein
MVVACVALFVALGGTSIAAVTALPRNSVGPAQLRNNAVTSQKIRAGAVTSTQVRNGSLVLRDFAADEIPQGAAGPAGAPGLSGFQVVSSTSGNNSDSPRAQSADCPAGKTAIGGGVRATGPGASEVLVIESYPSNVGQWHALAVEGDVTTNDWQLIVYAACATVAP